MRLVFLSIAPEFFESYLASHAVQLARRQGHSVEVSDLRDFADGSFRQVSDSPFGGGRGVVLRALPIFRAVEALTGRRLQERPGQPGGADGSLVAALTPTGVPFVQRTAHRYAACDTLVLLCGRFEGIDERALEAVDERISIGDYIVTGGEIPAMAVADAALRLLPGVLKAGSAEEESFETGLLEYPQYTQPAELFGQCVPEVLCSGDHAKVAEWRQAAAVRATARFRPDLLETIDLTSQKR